MCYILNNFFTSVFTDEDTTDIPISEQMCNVDIDSLTVDEEMFVKRLSQTKHSAPGPDKITKRILSELRDVVSQPLCMLSNKSLCTGEVPNDWRIAFVTPVFKKGSRSLAENYRPISLTSIVCKILEPVICKIIVAHLSEHTLLKSS